MNYLKKYWLLIVLFLVAAAIFANADMFRFAGALVYVPVLLLGNILLALMFRSIFNRDTTWPYVNDNDKAKGYDADFNHLAPVHKVWLTAIQIWIYLVTGAIVIHAAMG